MGEKKQERVTKTVTFVKGDGKTPTRHGPARSFNLRAPLDLVLQAGEARTVDLGLTCDRPVHIFPARGVVALGVILVDGIWAATDAEVPLTLRLLNTTRQEVVFGEGETLARCHVMDDSDWEEPA